MIHQTYPFVTVDVFTTRRFGGNPLAVFPDARGLEDAQMQALAAELNLSETTFVLPPNDPANTARVRIFNRTAEMPFAGHPNVGTGFTLARQGRDRDGVLRFEEMAGLVEVTIRRGTDGDVVETTIEAPQPLSLGERLPAEAIASCAELEASDIVTAGHEPVVASMGNAFVIAQVSTAALSRAAPDIDAFRNTVTQHPFVDGRLSLYLYARDATRIRARMFAPLAGTFEDAATGSAAAPLAALLLWLAGETTATYDIVQGVEMGRPSLLRTTARRTPDGIRAAVGGGCVPVLRGEAQV